MKIRIERDDNAMNPREDFDNLGKMVCFHSRHTLGDKHDFTSSDYVGWDGMEKAIREDEHTVVILPLYLYNHSGITMNTTGFSDPWDSGQVGFIYARREDVLKEFNVKRVTKKLRDKIEKILEVEVKTYDQYLTGDVWTFDIENEEGECVDSCGGFYGRESCECEARDVLEYWEKERKDAVEKLLRAQAAGFTSPCCVA